MDDAQLVATVDLFSPNLPPLKRDRLLREMRRINALSEEERQRELRQRIFRALQIPSYSSPTPPSRRA